MDHNDQSPPNPSQLTQQPHRAAVHRASRDKPRSGYIDIYRDILAPHGPVSWEDPNEDIYQADAKKIVDILNHTLPRGTLDHLIYLLTCSASDRFPHRAVTGSYQRVVRFVSDTRAGRQPERKFRVTIEEIEP